LCGLFAVYDLAIAVILATCLVFILVLVAVDEQREATSGCAAVVDHATRQFRSTVIYGFATITSSHAASRSSAAATRLSFIFELCPAILILRRTSSAQAPYDGASQAFVIAKIFASLIFKPCMIAPVSPAGACGIPPWTYPVVTQHPALPIMN
jgi:hypothetical protein